MKYRLAKLDRMNWTIERKYVRKDGREYWRPEGYYPRLEQCAVALIDLLLLDSLPDGTAASVKDLVTAVDKAKADVTALVRSLPKDPFNV